jgi:hypothetical protein
MHVVAPRDRNDWLTGIAPCNRLLALVVGQFRLAAEYYALLHGAIRDLASAFHDQLALELGDALRR